MLTPEDIKQQALNKFSDVVQAAFSGERIFPWDIRFGRADTSESLGDLRRQIELLLSGSFDQTGHGYRVALAIRRTRLHHEQSLPERVWFETPLDYLRFIGQDLRLERIKLDFADFSSAAPEAANWVCARARTLYSRILPGEGRALGLAVHALHTEPLPQCFAREIRLPGVSGKFVESRLKLIAEILQGIGSPGWREETTLHRQLGLRETPRLLRVMRLDGERIDYGVTEGHFVIPDGVESVIAVENLRSFLTLPALPKTLAIYGEGRAAETLSRLTVLSRVRLFYWGDMDPYGYAILNALRFNFPQTRSILMCQASLDRYADLLSACEVPKASDCSRLTDEEKSAAIFTRTRKQGVEQEKIPQDDVQKTLAAVLDLRYE